MWQWGTHCCAEVTVVWQRGKLLCGTGGLSYDGGDCCMGLGDCRVIVGEMVVWVCGTGLIVICQ